MCHKSTDLDRMLFTSIMDLNTKEFEILNDLPKVM